MKTIKLFLTIPLLFNSLTAYAGDGHAHGPDGSHVSESFETAGSSTTVTLSREAEKNIGIEVVTTTLRELSPTTTLYGRIIADPRRITEIAAPFKGQVEKIFVLPGEFVSKNNELIRVRPIQVGGEVTVFRATRSGYVTDLNTAAGRVFEATDTLLAVSDLEIVLFEGDLFDLSNASRMREPTSCSVHTKRILKKHFPCRVETVDATLRGNPPVGHVHASLRNADAELKPGMTGEIHLAFGHPKTVLTIPKKTVLGKFEKRFVYRRKDGSYLKTYVELGEVYGDHYEVIKGLGENEQVVTQGQYQLQFAKSDRASAHDHHEHSDHKHPHGDKDHHHSNHDHPHDDHTD